MLEFKALTEKESAEFESDLEKVAMHKKMCQKDALEFGH